MNFTIHWIAILVTLLFNFFLTKPTSDFGNKIVSMFGDNKSKSTLIAYDGTPLLQPPGYVFGIVWSTIYTLNLMYLASTSIFGETVSEHHIIVCILNILWIITLSIWYYGDLINTTHATHIAHIPQYVNVCKLLTPMLLAAICFTTYQLTQLPGIYGWMFVLYCTWTSLATLLNVYLVLGHETGWINERSYNAIFFFIFCSVSYVFNGVFDTEKRIVHSLVVSCVLGTIIKKVIQL